VCVSVHLYRDTSSAIAAVAAYIPLVSTALLLIAIIVLTSITSSSSSSKQYTTAAAHSTNSVPLLHRSEHTAAVTYMQRQQAVTPAAVTRGNGSVLLAHQHTSSSSRRGSSSSSSSSGQIDRLVAPDGVSHLHTDVSADVSSTVASWNSRLARMSSDELNAVLITSLPPCSDWPQLPLFVRLSPLVPNQVLNNFIC
jgi:hypothetical protein